MHIQIFLAGMRSAMRWRWWKSTVGP